MNRDDKAGWRPRRTLRAAEARALAERAFPGDRIEVAEPLSGGLRNTSIRVSLVGIAAPRVLRLYDADPGACSKERHILERLAPTVPVPALIDAHSEAADGLPPFLVLQYVQGITFRDLKNSGDREATAQAAASVGVALAAISSHRYPRPGRIGADGQVGDPFVAGPDPFLRFVDCCLDTPALQGRLDRALRERVSAHATRWASRLAMLDGDARLVHGDFGAANILVKQVGGAWQVAAVIDWEFAFSGSPLFDLGHFLRYERLRRPMREPAFSLGYRDAGGELPEDWREVARTVDLTSLVDLLTREEVPSDVVAEVSGMITATIEGRDPR